jgi:hypothetical protein
VSVAGVADTCLTVDSIFANILACAISSEQEIANGLELRLGLAERFGFRAEVRCCGVFAALGSKAP